MVLWKNSGSFASTRWSEIANRHTVSLEGSSILVELTARHGLCILLVEHDLDFVREISSRVIVLHQGRIVLDGTVQDVVESELVRTIYSGGAAGAAPA